ncbi:MAG: polyphosphate polymerase domain-containing protein [Prolixibacteraceae bacterium]
MNTIKPTLQSFNKLSLSDLDQVKLMNRTDHKFCLHRSVLPSILEDLRSEYSILEINGETVFEYLNTYFDTFDNQMFLNHQNGKGFRFKIRIRQYVQTKDYFLEIKNKTNKGRTIKKRIVRNDFQENFLPNELNFLQETSPYQGAQLYPKIFSKFNRITMVNKEFTERVTIDISPNFRNHENEVTLDNLVIIEVKQSKANKPARIIQVLRENKIKKQGFSKYCIGRSILEENIKKNNFKPTLLKIKKEYL